MQWPDQSRNLNPHREARLAMLVWAEEYTAHLGGSMDFWDSLDDNRKNLCRLWCTTLQETRRENPSKELGVAFNRVFLAVDESTKRIHGCFEYFDDCKNYVNGSSAVALVEVVVIPKKREDG